MSTETDSKPSLHKRSDGFVETPEGDFAVVMKFHALEDAEGVREFSYKPTFNAQTIRVQWHKDDLLQIFPSEIAGGLVRLNYARLPTADELSEFLAAPVAEEAPAKEPEKKATSAPKTPPAPDKE